MGDFLNISALQAKVGVAGAFVGTMFTYVFGWNDILIALLCLMVLDWLSGILSAVISTEEALDSSKGYKGIGKKVGILFCVGVAHVLSVSLNVSAVYDVVLWFYIANEGLSILENMGKCGVPLPDALTKQLEQLKDNKIK